MKKEGINGSHPPYGAKKAIHVTAFSTSGHSSICCLPEHVSRFKSLIPKPLRINTRIVLSRACCSWSALQFRDQLTIASNQESLSNIQPKKSCRTT